MTAGFRNWASRAPITRASTSDARVLRSFSQTVEPRLSYQQLVHEYENGWIRRIGQGAYVRVGGTVEWPGGLLPSRNK